MSSVENMVWTHPYLRQGLRHSVDRKLAIAKNVHLGQMRFFYVSIAQNIFLHIINYGFWHFLLNLATTWRDGYCCYCTNLRICKPFKEPRNRFLAWRAGTTTLFTYGPTRLQRLAESILWNRFLGSLIVYKYGLRTWSWGYADGHWLVDFEKAISVIFDKWFCWRDEGENERCGELIYGLTIWSSHGPNIYKDTKP